MGIGIKTQVPNVFNGLSVRENIWLAVRRKCTPKAQRPAADAVLDMMRLGNLAHRMVATLSHGQRQWVEIGMVIAAEPELVLLDEPAAGLTDEETFHTAAIIREMNKYRAIVVVEHDMQFIKQIAKTVTVFHRGRVLMEDTVNNVLVDQRVRDVYLGKKVVT
jgi:branched-chain amino acid transport system ATP-binding protein/urea transport system ATP-binding protein